MTAQNHAIFLWLSKLFQVISTIILTPEIIGPDRFEKLENHITSQDFSKKDQIIWLAVFITGFVLCLPWVLVETSHTLATVSGNQWIPPVGFGWIILFILLNVLGLYFIIRPHELTKLIQATLIKFAAYLRKVSLFRSIAVAIGVALFFLGIGIELVLEWPF